MNNIQAAGYRRLRIYSTENMKRNGRLLNTLYSLFLEHYGMQGWWPVINLNAGKSEYKKTIRRNEADKFEIAIGAILTQNVTWKNAEKALLNLKTHKMLDPVILSGVPAKELAGMIRPSGYYNQKAVKIKNFLMWLEKYDFSLNAAGRRSLKRLRPELLSVRGIGPETADSILLYSLSKKVFVVDAYTRRIFSRVGIIGSDEKYEDIQRYFHDNFMGGIREYNEYHALIVMHAKERCWKKIDKNGDRGCSCCIIENRCSKIFAPAGLAGPGRRGGLQPV